MAQRRMFSPDIVNSDAFLEMPPSTQALYFQLGMKADDDGFVNPKMVMKMMGSSEDEIKVLIAKRFVLPFENGVLVIKHWKINNLVRKDWYRPTRYVEEKKRLFIKENGSYTDDSEAGVPLVNEPLTQVRLGKVIIPATRDENSMKKNRLGKYNEQDSSDSYETVIEDGIELLEKNKEILPHYKELLKWAEDKRKFPIPTVQKQYAAMKNMRLLKIPIDKVKERWEEMENDPFWSEKGFDFMDVYLNFVKKPPQ